RVGAADGRRRIVCGAPRRRGAPGPGADPPLRPASMRRPIAPGLLAALVLLAPGARAAEDVDSATLAGAEGQAIVEVTVAPGWHVNAHDPRDDFLVPTTLTLLPPDGMRAGEVVYPEPVERRLAFGGDHALRLYTGRVRFTARLEGTPAAGAGPLRAALRYQACNDSRCLPPRTLELVARGAPASGRAGRHRARADRARGEQPRALHLPRAGPAHAARRARRRRRARRLLHGAHDGHRGGPLYRPDRRGAAALRRVAAVGRARLRALLHP